MDMFDKRPLVSFQVYSSPNFYFKFDSISEWFLKMSLLLQGLYMNVSLHKVQQEAELALR
jgi:hypothetical protein